MNISPTDKVNPAPPLGAVPLTGFWELVGPRLINPPSLAIIQALIREGRYLSATDLADELELGVAPIREQLTAMESEGILVRDLYQDHSSEQAGDAEPLFGLREPSGVPPAPTGRVPAVGNPRLSRAGRDALYRELVVDLAQVPDLERLAESENPRDIAACEQIGERVLNALRLIHESGIGWGSSGDSDYVELSLDPGELVRLASDRHRMLIDFIESQRAGWERDHREFGEFVEARDACGTILLQLKPVLGFSSPCQL